MRVAGLMAGLLRWPGRKVALMITGITRLVGAHAAFGVVDHPVDRVQTAVPSALA
jgi:hypothetical protein